MASHLVAGMWASKQEPFDVYRCAEYGVCAGSGVDNCNNGRSGTACSACADAALTPGAFGGACQACEGLPLYGCLALLATLLALAMIVIPWSVLYSKQRLDEEDEKDFPRAQRARAIGLTRRGQTAIAIHIALHGIQVIALAAESLRGLSPAALKALSPDAQGMLALFVFDASLYRPACILGALGLPSGEYAGLALSWCLPPAWLLAVMLLAYLLRLRRRFCAIFPLRKQSPADLNEPFGNACASNAFSTASSPGRRRIATIGERFSSNMSYLQRSPLLAVEAPTKRQAIRCLQMCMYIFLAPLVKLSLRAFECRYHPGGAHTFAPAPSVSCEVARLSLLPASIPLFLIYCVGPASYVLWVLLHRPESMQRSLIHLQVKAKRWRWPMVVTLKNVACAVISAIDPSAGALSGLVIVEAVYWVLLCQRWPWCTETLNRFDCLLTAIIFGVCVTALAAPLVDSSQVVGAPRSSDVVGASRILICLVVSALFASLLLIARMQWKEPSLAEVYAAGMADKIGMANELMQIALRVTASENLSFRKVIDSIDEDKRPMVRSSMRLIRESFIRNPKQATKLEMQRWEALETMSGEWMQRFFFAEQGTHSADESRSNGSTKSRNSQDLDGMESECGDQEGEDSRHSSISSIASMASLRDLWGWTSGSPAPSRRQSVAASKGEDCDEEEGGTPARPTATPSVRMSITSRRQSTTRRQPSTTRSRRHPTINLVQRQSIAKSQRGSVVAESGSLADLRRPSGAAPDFLDPNAARLLNTEVDFDADADDASAGSSDDAGKKHLSLYHVSFAAFADVEGCTAFSRSRSVERNSILGELSWSLQQGEAAENWPSPEHAVDAVALSTALLGVLQQQSNDDDRSMQQEEVTYYLYSPEEAVDAGVLSMAFLGVLQQHSNDDDRLADSRSKLVSNLSSNSSASAGIPLAALVASSILETSFVDDEKGDSACDLGAQGDVGEDVLAEHGAIAFKLSSTTSVYTARSAWDVDEGARFSKSEDVPAVSSLTLSGPLDADSGASIAGAAVAYADPDAKTAWKERQAKKKALRQSATKGYGDYLRKQREEVEDISSGAMQWTERHRSQTQNRFENEVGRVAAALRLAKADASGSSEDLEAATIACSDPDAQAQWKDRRAQKKAARQCAKTSYGGYLRNQREEVEADLPSALPNGLPGAPMESCPARGSCDDPAATDPPEGSEDLCQGGVISPKARKDEDANKLKKLVLKGSVSLHQRYSKRDEQRAADARDTATTTDSASEASSALAGGGEASAGYEARVADIKKGNIAAVKKDLRRQFSIPARVAAAASAFRSLGRAGRTVSEAPEAATPSVAPHSPRAVPAPRAIDEDDEMEPQSIERRAGSASSVESKDQTNENYTDDAVVDFQPSLLHPDLINSMGMTMRTSSTDGGREISSMSVASIGSTMKDLGSRIGRSASNAASKVAALLQEDDDEEAAGSSPFGGSSAVVPAALARSGTQLSSGNVPSGDWLLPQDSMLRLVTNQTYHGDRGTKKAVGQINMPARAQKMKRAKTVDKDDGMSDGAWSSRESSRQNTCQGSSSLAIPKPVHMARRTSGMTPTSSHSGLSVSTSAMIELQLTGIAGDEGVSLDSLMHTRQEKRVIQIQWTSAPNTFESVDDQANDADDLHQTIADMVGFFSYNEDGVEDQYRKTRDAPEAPGQTSPRMASQPADPMISTVSDGGLSEAYSECSSIYDVGPGAAPLHAPEMSEKDKAKFATWNERKDMKKKKRLEKKAKTNGSFARQERDEMRPGASEGSGIVQPFGGEMRVRAYSDADSSGGASSASRIIAELTDWKSAVPPEACNMKSASQDVPDWEKDSGAEASQRRRWA